MDPEVHRFTLMLDVSGSTHNSKNYWSTVGDILSLYGHEIDCYYEWDTSIRQVTKKQIQAQIFGKNGRGGTSPEIVAEEIVKRGIRRIILITDGQVGDQSVQKCDKILSGYQFTQTICYIIASTGGGNLNMSVTCPFTRNCDNQVYEKQENLPLKKLAKYTPSDYKILDSLDQITLQNFEESYQKIEGLIISLNMGKASNIPLKNQLVVMKNRLVKQISQQKALGETDINKQIRFYLQKKDFGQAIKVVSKMTKEYFSDSMTNTLEKRVSHLINLCGDLRGKYNINQIKSNKMLYAQDAKEGKINKIIQASELSANLIECPIIMDEDVPQILVDESQPILLGFEKFIVDDIEACPLRVLNYPEVKAKLKSRLSNFMGVKYGDKLLKNPFTQRKLLGAIPLGCHQSHVVVGNHTIAKMFSGGKIIGNLNMFYAAIWYIIKEREIEYLNQIEKNTTEHLIFRLKTSKTTASLCGLAQFVTTQLNSDLAVWYCVNSGLLNQPTDRDTFRFHTFNMNPLIDIVEVLGYQIDQGVYKHLKRTKAVLSTLSWYKKISNNQKKSFNQAVRSLYQNSFQVNPENISPQVQDSETIVRFIPIDGEAQKYQVQKALSTLPKHLKQITLQEIIYIGNQMDAQKSASDIFLDYNLKVDQPQAKINWPYKLSSLEQMKFFSEFKLNKNTLRLNSEYGQHNWQKFIQIHTNIPSNKLFKGRRYFQQFLKKYRRLPNKDELAIFYYNRYVVQEKVDTLPFLTQIWIKEIIQEYKNALEQLNISVGQAVARLESSRPRGTRLYMQNGAQLNVANILSKLNVITITSVDIN